MSNATLPTPADFVHFSPSPFETPGIHIQRDTHETIMNRFDIPAESFQLRSSVQTATDSLEESEREKERAVTLARYRVYESLDTSVRRMSDKCVLYLLLTRARVHHANTINSCCVND